MVMSRCNVYMSTYGPLCKHIHVRSARSGAVTTRKSPGTNPVNSYEHVCITNGIRRSRRAGAVQGFFELQMSIHGHDCVLI